MAKGWLGNSLLLLCWSSGAWAQASVDPSQHTLRPRSVADLDCASLDVDLTPMAPRLLALERIAEPRTLFQALSSGTMQKAQNAARLDPNGLCHYRDKNKSLNPSARIRVVFLGDSITENWSIANPQLFTEGVINRGISGQNTSQMLARFRQDVVDLHPGVVHIMAGINDLNLPTGSMLTRSNIMSMVDLAKRNGIEVVLGSITPASYFWMFPEMKPGPEIAGLNDWMKGYAKRNGIRYVDYHSALRDRDLGIRSNLSNEGLHPNGAGYSIMTPLAKAAISPSLR